MIGKSWQPRRRGEVIVTHDLDFGYILASSGSIRPSVVILRQRNVHPQKLYHSITTTAESWASAVAEGAIVILEDGALRIRPLPISGDE
jgi:predicted nuclease of predicted toxin-antitoxin system